MYVLELKTADMMLVFFIHTTLLLAVTAQHNLTPFGTATQSTYIGGGSGEPEYAIYPPISNQFSVSICSHTYFSNSKPAWWMFEFSFGYAYITEIQIYYREGYASRMDGFKLYVTNTSTIPPVGYLCYEDPDPGLPNITQTIPCYQLGKYVIYYDDKGVTESDDPVIELCYVAINGCENGTWGTNCTKECPSTCIEQHCYPGNGSCILGCETQNCLNDICNIQTGVCTDGCVNEWIGQFCSLITTEDLKKLLLSGKIRNNKLIYRSYDASTVQGFSRLVGCVQYSSNSCQKGLGDL